MKAKLSKKQRIIDAIWVFLFPPDPKLKRTLQLEAAVAPELKKLGMQPKKTMLDGRAQGSLQLAFRGAHSLNFFDGGDFGVGVYEIVDDKQQELQKMVVYIELLQHSSPHLYFDNKSNNHRFRQNMPEKIQKAQLVYCEGYFSDRYNFYAPEGYAIDSLVVGAPDVLDAIDRLNLGGDIEVLGNQFYMIFPDMIDLPVMLGDIVKNGHELAKEIDDNLSRYRDDRAKAENVTIGYDGRRIIRK